MNPFNQVATKLKICSKCKRSLPYTDYSKDKRKADGLHNYCKLCRAENARDKRFDEKYERTLCRKQGMSEREFNIHYKKFSNYVRVTISKKLRKQLVTRAQQEAYKRSLGEWEDDLFIETWIDFYTLPAFPVFREDDTEIKKELLKIVDKLCKRIYRNKLEGQEYKIISYRNEMGAVDINGKHIDNSLLVTHKTPARFKPDEKKKYTPGTGKGHYWKGCSKEMNKGIS